MKRNAWFKSTRSGNNGACVEVMDTGETVKVRDSKNPTGPELTFTLGEWEAFVGGTKNGEFDL